MVRFVRGNIFDCQAVGFVNPVNCMGVMGAGLALEFKNRCPSYFREYKEKCRRGGIVPGRVDVCRSVWPWIISFPTKRHWKDKSQMEDVSQGLSDLVWYEFDGTVAVPALGCGLGGLSWVDVKAEMERILGPSKHDFHVFEPKEWL